MDSSTNIKSLLSQNQINVPTYQRAYSWETRLQTANHVSIFLSDLDDYIQSPKTSKYYFGHFLFEKYADQKYGIIDGQQRLTTITICLSALFSELKKRRQLTDEEDFLYKSMIKIGQSSHFSTVNYDDRLFQDYVINQCINNPITDTESQKRIVAAFKFFSDIFSKRNEQNLCELLEVISNAKCTTYQVEDPSEAIQMFIFQNNRGKKPTNLEIIKAQFLYNVHLYAREEKDSIIKEIEQRFAKIYQSISSVEAHISEDDVLTYTLRVYFNNLNEDNAIEKVDKELKKDTRIDFIKDFTLSLNNSFEYLRSFYNKDEKENYDIHSLVSLNNNMGIAIPFIIKAYSNNLSIETIGHLCHSLETLFVRQSVIGRGAGIAARINDVYQNFTNSIDAIVERINWLKNPDSWWWQYWDDEQFYYSLTHMWNHDIGKFILWKYENYLKTNGKEKGYSWERFETIPEKHLEHIAPQTPTNGEPIAAGYCEYDDDFKNDYLNSIGNWLLLSKSHNISIGNKPFSEKRATYTYNLQQREIYDKTEDDCVWSKAKIKERENKIVEFIKEIY